VDNAGTEIALCTTDEIPEGEMRQFELDGGYLLLCHAGSEIHAVDGTCPHRGAQLVQGQLEGTSVTCPWHDWEFNVQSGCGITNPNSHLKKFEVSVREGIVYLIRP